MLFLELVAKDGGAAQEGRAAVAAFVIDAPDVEEATEEAEEVGEFGFFSVFTLFGLGGFIFIARLPGKFGVGFAGASSEDEDGFANGIAGSVVEEFAILHGGEKKFQPEERNAADRGIEFIEEDEGDFAPKDGIADEVELDGG